MFKLIMAISKNGVIGDKGKLAWKCPEDMAHFKETTAGGICVMGRKTYQGLPRPRVVRDQPGSKWSATYPPA
jgi:dihydrofolate reductase